MGDRLISRFIHFEAEPAPAGDPGGEPPAAAEPPPPEGGGEGEVWTPSREDFEALQETVEPLRGLAEALEGATAPGMMAPPPSGYEPEGGDEPLRPPDPYSPNYAAEMAAFVEDNNRRLEERFFSAVRPVMDRTYRSTAEEQLEAAWGQLDENARSLGLSDEHGDAVYGALVDVASAHLNPELLASPDFDIVPHIHQALSESAAQLSPLIEAAKAQGRDEYIASLRGEDGGEGGGEGEGPRHEPGVAGGGLEGVAPARSYGEVIERHLGSLS